MPADLFVPDELTLRLFLLGRLAGPEADRVERFLETNPEAASTLRALAAEDTFTSALRDQPAADEVDSEVHSAIARLEGLLTESGERTTSRDDVAESRADPGEGTEDALTFLAPARGPDELGRLGGYRVLRVLGVGGMGTVLEADDPKLGRRVAIKVMRPRVATSPKAVHRFLQEARAAAAVEHDHIIPIWYIGEDNGVPYIVMPFLKGESLNARLDREDRLPAADIVRIGVEAAEGLSAAHAKGLVHRDIKPANLWLEAPRGRVKVLDFGLARLTRQDGRLTQAGAIVGTPAYMAPEQARGLSVDARTDLFSLGATLYRAATGRNPFRGTDTMSMLMSLASDTPADPRALNPDLPPHLADLIQRLLEKDPARRPQSAREVISLLAPPTVETLPDPAGRQTEFAFDDDATQVEVQPAGPKPARSPKRKRGPARLLIGTAIALLALIGIGVGTYKLVFETQDGTLEVVIADKEAEARFKNGELHLYVGDQLKYTVKPSDQNRKLPPGDYKVRVSDPNGLDVDTREFTLKKGDHVTVRVTARPPAVAKVAAKGAPPGYGLGFDGAGYAHVPYLSHDGPNPTTLEAWVRPGPRTDPAVVAVLAGAARLQLGRNSDGYFSLDSYTPVQPDGSAPVAVGRWTHLAVVADTGELRFYSDGILRRRLPRQAGRLHEPPFAGLWLGGHPVGNEMGAHLEGTLAEVRVSRGARYRDDFTPAGRFEPDKDTLALYHCDDGTGDVLKDSSGHGRHGKVVGAKWVKVDGSSADPDRAAAEYVMSVGGKVRVNGSDPRLKEASELPPGPFRLTTISLQSNRQVTDAGLAVLAGCRYLEVAWLNGSQVGDNGLAYLNTTSLRELHVDTRPITNAGLARFAAAKNLTQLNVGNTKVTGPGLAALVDCPNLTKLWAYGLAIGDDDLSIVCRWKKLEHLSLSRTRVTDAGLLRLAGMTTLRELHLVGTKVTADGVNKLASALPACRIEWDGGVVVPKIDK